MFAIFKIWKQIQNPQFLLPIATARQFQTWFIVTCPPWIHLLISFFSPRIDITLTNKSERLQSFSHVISRTFLRKNGAAWMSFWMVFSENPGVNFIFFHPSIYQITCSFWFLIMEEATTYRNLVFRKSCWTFAFRSEELQSDWRQNCENLSFDSENRAWAPISRLAVLEARLL